MTDDDLIVTVRAAGTVVRLPPGQSATFGRDDVADPLSTGRHLALSANPRLHAQAGRVDVDELGWLLTNTGRWLRLLVTDAHTSTRVELVPGRVLRVPYARCRVEVTTGDEVLGLDIDCPWLARAGTVDDEPQLSGATVDALGLDRGTGYYRALVALCAPRLRDPHSTELSSVAEVTRLLNQSGREPQAVTVKAVERRLANLRRKVGLSVDAPYGGSAAGLEVRDAARQLAELALRTGAVTEADLDLLHPGPEAGGA